MSPIEYIAEGIRQGNWEIICEGYERLTGEALPLPTTSTTTSEAEDALRKIKNIISNTPVEFKKITKKKLRGRPKGSGRKKVATVTDGEDCSLQLNDSNRTIVQKEIGETQLITNEPDPKEIEKNKAKAMKARRNKIKLDRKASTKHDVKCNECEKIFKSDRPKGEMGQKCPGCLRDKKSRFV